MCETCVIGRLAAFLRTFTGIAQDDDSRTPIYLNAIRMMCNNNEQSFEVSFLHLAGYGGSLSQISDWLMKKPEIICEYFNEVGAWRRDDR